VREARRHAPADANDAPALAQADVGVAMKPGRRPAKEAGNMVDLDRTRPSCSRRRDRQAAPHHPWGLTTFSIDNDVAKYFAIIPSCSWRPPRADDAQTSCFSQPGDAVLSAVIFNALIIVALIPPSRANLRWAPPPPCPCPLLGWLRLLTLPLVSALKE